MIDIEKVERSEINRDFERALILLEAFYLRIDCETTEMLSYIVDEAKSMVKKYERKPMLIAVKTQFFRDGEILFANDIEIEHRESFNDFVKLWKEHDTVKYNTQRQFCMAVAQFIEHKDGRPVIYW